MPKYNEFFYDTDYYGTRSALAYNAEPMDALTINYGYATVYYTVPDGDYVAFRIVRNQEAFPQSESDGAIIYTAGSAPEGSPIKDDESFEDAPLVQGRIAYYRAWVQKDVGGDWVPAGDAETLIPKKHSLGLPLDTVYTLENQYPTKDAKVNQDDRVLHELSTTHERFMGLFPKVLVTTTNSPLDEIENSYSRAKDESGVTDNSLISTFLSAFSFTVDEFITLAKLTYPDFAGHGASADILALRTHEFGLTSDVEPVTQTQKKLLRNAVEIYKTKGTAHSLQYYVESVTGYNVVISTTKNLILTHEDSTFDVVDWVSGDPVGYWATVTGTPTLSADFSQTPAVVATAIDRLFITSTGGYGGYAGKVVTGGTTASIGLGVTAPITRGIPVTAGAKYSLSFYVQNAASAQVTPEIRWYDRKGVFISATTGTATNSAATFTRLSFSNKTAPDKALYACPVIKFSSNATYYLDMVQFEEGTTVTPYYEPRAAYVTIDPDPADSIAIYNRITRVKNEIKDYVPFNLPYYVEVLNSPLLFNYLIKGYA